MVKEIPGGVLEDLRETEAEGRRRAFARDRIPLGDYDFIRTDFSRGLKVMAEEFRRSGLSGWNDLAVELDNLVWDRKFQARECERNTVKRSECEIPSDSYLDRIDRKAKKLTGERCTWLKGVREPYNLSSFLNDATACFHRCVEKYEDIRGKWEREGKCIWMVEEGE